MYYGAGLLSTVDRYPERHVSRSVVQPLPSRGRRGRPADRGTARSLQKARRGRVRDGRCNDGTDQVSQYSVFKQIIYIICYYTP